jgi:hypothetical protein
MVSYGITRIKLNKAGTEVEEAKVHWLTSGESPGDVGLGGGEAMTRQQVASLIRPGHKVYVIVADESGVYQKTGEVRVKPGLQEEYLESFGEDGAANDALMALQKCD